MPGQLRTHSALRNVPQLGNLNQGRSDDDDGAANPNGRRDQASKGRSRYETSTPAARGPDLFREIQTGKPNVVIFGETGTGKSSLINMIADDEVTIVSNAATGCTFGSAGYSVTIGGTQCVLWDTAGLNEGEVGSVPAEQALDNLRDLVEKLKDGISLLVYCIRGSRYRDILKVNYDLFTRIICQGCVPVVVVVTGLENESPMDDWWINNEDEFTKHDIRFEGHVCITASRGKRNKQGGYLCEEEYEASKGVVRELIKKHCPSPTTAWIVDSDLWFPLIAKGISDYYDAYNGYLNQRDGHHLSEDEGGLLDSVLGRLEVTFAAGVTAVAQLRRLLTR